MIDTHTHTKFSCDGKSTPHKMAERGKKLGLTYMAFTDHCDRDYTKLYKYLYVGQLDVEEYMKAVTEMKEEYPFLALGIELGYSKQAVEDYKNLPLDKFDYVLNSIHTVNGLDCYTSDFFEGRTKKEAYEKYLLKVLESVNAEYSFDTISHIGFVRKNAPYEDKSMTMAEFGDILDEIFKGIIERNKTLELNCNIKSKDFMPTKELVARYYELGGRNISFASDAHVRARVAENYNEGAELVKEIGFTHWTVYRERKPIKVPIE